MKALLAFVLSVCCVGSVAASTGTEVFQGVDLTETWYGVAALGIFILAYAFVPFENNLHLKKSKPVVVAAGLIWLLVGVAYRAHGEQEFAHAYFKDVLVELAELFFFLLSAMTYVNTLQERGVFESLRGWIISKGLSLRAVFWITGLLAFFISPVADNMTTALLMCNIVLAVGAGNLKFVQVSLINIVVAANAGGAFSPFGDITTLMVWQSGKVEFIEFLDLFIPAVTTWLVPAFAMSLVIEHAYPQKLEERPVVKKGGLVTLALFIFTIVLAVFFHNYLDLPAMMGMMFGLGLLKLYGYYIKLHELKNPPQYLLDSLPLESEVDLNGSAHKFKPKHKPFDIMVSVKRAEWDTLLFFFGVMFCVGGLGVIGYLVNVSHYMYTVLGPGQANTLVGILSAVIDNIPVMFAVLTMDPDMPHGQWLLVTLTTGVGGSLLSMGSAAGVALMGQARGVYTFFGHLKWTPFIAAGYFIGIWVHYLWNASLF